MGFPKQEYLSGLPFPSPGDLPHPGIEPMSPALAGGFFITEQPGKPTLGGNFWESRDSQTVLRIKHQKHDICKKMIYCTQH